MPQILSRLSRLRIFRQDADFSDMFMVSYDVVSPFANIPLSETIDLAASMPYLIIKLDYLVLKLKIQLKELFNFLY